MKILIDNGHGIFTAGKRSPDGELREGIYTREISRRLTSRLQALGLDASLLVPEEEDIPLTERCIRANKQSIIHGTKNVIIISIHCNAARSDGKWHNARGWSVYTSKGQTDADRLADCLAKSAAKNLPDEIVRADWSDGDVDLEAGFYILRKTLSPAVLTENLFMDNLKQKEFLLSEEGKNAIVQLHVDGILEYLNAGQSSMGTLRISEK